MFTPSNFTLTKFLSTLILMSNSSQDTSLEIKDRYINPIARYLRMAFTRQESRLELVDRLELIVSYEEAEWLGNTFWVKFVNNIKEVIGTGEDLVREIASSSSFALIEENLPVLE